MMVKVEAGGLQVQGQPRLHGKTLCQKLQKINLLLGNVVFVSHTSQKPNILFLCNSIKFLKIITFCFYLSVPLAFLNRHLPNIFMFLNAFYVLIHLILEATRPRRGAHEA
jgi:hypothetical protein